MSESERLPSIPEPRADTQALFQTVSALKQVVELLAGQRGTATSLRVATASVVESNVQALNTSISDAQASLQAAIDAVAGDLATLQAQVDAYALTTDADIASIYAQIATINGEITTLQSRCTALEAALTEVEIADLIIPGTTTIDVTWPVATYRYITIMLVGFGTATAGTSTSNLRMQLYQGGVLKTGASDYQAHLQFWTGASGGAVNAAAASFQLSSAGLSAVVSPAFARIHIDPGAVNFPRAMADCGTQANTGAFHHAMMNSVMLTRSAEVSGARFFWQSGQSFANVGRIIVKGYKI